MREAADVMQRTDPHAKVPFSMNRVAMVGKSSDAKEKLMWGSLQIPGLSQELPIHATLFVDGFENVCARVGENALRSGASSVQLNNSLYDIAVTNIDPLLFEGVWSLCT
jgi:hypothetical protein